MIKCVTIVGARPQFIKSAVVSEAFRRTEITEVLVDTGQHYDDTMAAVFFEELRLLQPSYNLKIGSSAHGAQTGKMLAAIEEVLQREMPALVLVYGDTNSTLAGALAATKMHIPVAHVEAGLRSFNRRMPEEINRVLTDHVSSFLFAPTDTAVENLQREGIKAGVQLTGDVMFDVALRFADLAKRKSQIVDQLGLTSGQYVLATIHRAENTDSTNRLHAIFEGLSMIAEELPVVIPLHPRTRKALERAGLLARMERSLRIVEPKGYLDLTRLLQNARLAVTDSGGIQKEAFFHRVPVVTLRDETEWQELVDVGWNALQSPVDSKVVADCVRRNLSKEHSLESVPGILGNGTAAHRIVSALASLMSRE